MAQGGHTNGRAGGTRRQSRSRHSGAALTARSRARPEAAARGLLTCLIEVLGQLRALPAARLAGDDEEGPLADGSHQGPPVAADGQRATLHGGGAAPQGPPARAAALSGKPRPPITSRHAEAAPVTRACASHAPRYKKPRPFVQSHAPFFIHVTSLQGGPAWRHAPVTELKALLFPSNLPRCPF